MNTPESQRGQRDRERREVQRTHVGLMELVGLAYDAGSGDTPWRAFFSELGQHLGSHGWTLVVHGAGPTRYASLDDPDRGFSTVNPVNVFKERALARQSFVVGLIGNELVDDWSQLAFAAAHDSSSSHCGPVSGVEVFKAPQAATSETVDRLLRKLLPHLKRAAGMFFENRDRRAEAALLQACFDELADSVIVIDRSARVVRTNRAASKAFSRRAGIVLDGGRLATAAEADERAFENNVSEAFSGGKVLRGQKLASGDTLWVRSVSREHALVFIPNPGPSRRLPPRILQNALDVTPAQARVGSLFMSGLELREIAAELELSLHTVRLHVKKIQAKTGTRRQASLAVHALGAIPRVVDPY